MIPLRRQVLLTSLKLFDLAILVFCFFLSVLLLYESPWSMKISHILSIRVKVQNLIIFSVLFVLWYVFLNYFELYQSRRLSSQKSEILNIAKASVLATTAIGVFAFVFPFKLITPISLAVFWALSSGLIILSRIFLRHFLRYLRVRGRNLRQVLIVGTNPRAIKFARKILAKPELGYQLKGFVDNHFGQREEFQKLGYPLVANFGNLSDYLRNHVVDEIIICLPMKSFYQVASQIIAICEEQGIIVRFHSSLFNLKVAESRVEEFEDDQIITMSTGSMKGAPIILKRFLDIFASLLLLVISSPLFLIVSVAIKSSSPGPIFFIQERIGLNKRRFRLYKFRTMVQDAEKMQAELKKWNEATGPVFKIKNDPRVTKIGRILRKTSIDEIPQLINVLKGDMSLVGPRPLPVRDYEGFDQDWHRRRFSVRPGLTCLWQVNGRSDTPFEKWMKLDMEYIDNWSLRLDFKILLKTIPAVIRGSGAA